MGYPIKQNQTARVLIFLMVDSTDHITPKTGLTPTVTLSKNGGSLASPAGAVSEIGQGLYKVAGNATDANTLGPLILHATATGADPSDTLFEVVAYDPESATSLGLSNLDAAISSRASQASLDTIDDFLDTEVAAIKAQTDLIPASPAAVGSAMTLEDGAITAAKIATGAIDADAIATDAVTEIQSGLSTLNAAGVRSAIGLASANLDTQLDSLPTAAEVATAVQANTSLLDLAVMVTGDGTAGAKFTTTALSNAPSGGGGGGGTIVIERQIRLSLDTANPIAEPFALMQGDAYTLKAYITDYNGDPVPLTGYTLTASATNTLGTEVDAPTVTAHDEELGIVDIAITTDLTASVLAKGWLSVKFTDGTNTYVTVPTEISVGAR